MKFSRIYNFLRQKLKNAQQQDQQTQTVKQKQRLPVKRILITYGAFSLLFIVLATAAWFAKGPEFLSQLQMTQKTASNMDADLRKYDDKKITPRKQEPDDKPTANNYIDAASIDKLHNKVKQLKDEMQQLNAELDAARIQQYIASAQYLIETRTAPERALSLLQSARSYMETHPKMLNANTSALLDDIDSQIVRLQQYLAHSPDKALILLTPLIDHIQTQLQDTPNSQTEKNIVTEGADNGWVEKWLSRAYALSKNLIKIEDPKDRYIEDNRLLLKLLLTARLAILSNEEKQFYAALKDALKLIDVMPQPPISKAQIEALLDLKIVWQLPKVRR